MSNSNDTVTAPTGPLEAMIAELRQELEVTQGQRREISLLVKQTNAELERLVPKVREAASRVQRAQTSPDSYSRTEIKQVYEASQEAQLRQFMMKSQLEQLGSREGNLQKAEALLARLLAQAVSITEAPLENGSAPGTTPEADPMDVALASLELAMGRVSLHLQENTSQKLSQLMMRSEVCERLLDTDQERAREELSELREVSSGALKATRGVIHVLRPPALDEAGLAPALRRFVEAAELGETAQVDVQVDGVERRLPRHVELGTFRIVQEALLNAVRHAGAGRIDLALAFQPGQLAAKVSDDGHGFDVDAAQQEKGPMHLSGLAGMQRWARLIGATLAITSTPSGTTVELTIPR